MFKKCGYARARIVWWVSSSGWRVHESVSSSFQDLWGEAVSFWEMERLELLVALAWNFGTIEITFYGTK